MNSREVSILFMDDEFGLDGKKELTEAKRQMENEGWFVEVVTSMEDAVEAFFDRHFHVFVLDIDMHLTRALGSSPEDLRGTKVAKMYTSIDNGCAVIFYSAHGTAEEVFIGANLHAYGYVKKDEGPARLITVIKQALNDDLGSLSLPFLQESGDILVIETKDSPIKRNDWNEMLKTLGPQYRLVFLSLAEAAKSAGSGNYVSIVMAAPVFGARQFTDMAAVCSLQPKPHVVLACECREGDQNTLVSTLNLRPFRLVNLLDPEYPRVICDAVKRSLQLFNAREVFPAALEYTQRATRSIDWSAIEDARTALEEDAELWQAAIDAEDEDRIAQANESGDLEDQEEDNGIESEPGEE